MELALKHGLRGYDSIQLSAAVELNAISSQFETPVFFVSADDDRNAAAGNEGLTVENPNLYP